jgi:hypothetical protein
MNKIVGLVGFQVRSLGATTWFNLVEVVVRPAAESHLIQMVCFYMLLDLWGYFCCRYFILNFFNLRCVCHVFAALVFTRFMFNSDYSLDTDELNLFRLLC